MGARSAGATRIQENSIGIFARVAASQRVGLSTQ